MWGNSGVPDPLVPNKSRMRFSRIVCARLRSPVALLACLAVLGITAAAERLPIRVYGDADGLGSTFVNQIVRDSRGFLWFCTRGGLSRFDGTRFRTYDEHSGLPYASINHILESREGAYWIATNGVGVCRLEPTMSSIQASGSNWRGTGQSTLQFKTYKVGEAAESNRVNVVVQDRAGRIWAGTDWGLFVLEDPEGQGTFQHVDCGLAQSGMAGDISVSCIIEDHQGTLWIGTAANGVLRKSPDGRLVDFSTAQGLASAIVLALLEDSQHRLWAGTNGGLCQLRYEPDPTGSIVEKTYLNAVPAGGSRPVGRARANAARDPESSDDIKIVTALCESSSGLLWIGSRGGLIEFDGTNMRIYTVAQGLVDNAVGALAEDLDGNLWIGTSTAGAMKLARKGLITYTEADGLGTGRIHSVLEDETGAVIAASGTPRICRFDGTNFVGVHVPVPADLGVPWSSQDVYMDRERRWWVLTDNGIWRFPKVTTLEQLETARPVVYSETNGLYSDRGLCILEDSRGDIWLGTSVRVGVHSRAASGGLTRIESATGAFHQFSPDSGLPRSSTPASFCEDRGGNVWIAFVEGGLARYRNGQFQLFNSADGLPPGPTGGLFLDHAGRLWFGSTLGGLGRVDDPNADRPVFATYTTSQGLTNNGVRCITEDLFGRIYAGTVRGIDRLDPATGLVRHFATSDGLANDFVMSAFRDRQGKLWFGTLKGISCLVPEPDQREASQPALINSISVMGVHYPVSELGQSDVPPLTLGSGENSIEIGFFAVGFAAGGAPRYQYRLEGEGRDWSEPTEQRTINYASLSPGRYRFEVRAITADEGTSSNPAVFSFRVLQPIWRRWWFMSLAALAIVLAASGFHMYRLSRAVELERVRARIAADLHDDIGSSLSQIALLSGLLRTQLAKGESAASNTIASMYRISAESLDSMSDIVWAINPQRDHLVDLSRRMRRFASDTLSAGGIDLSFTAPDQNADLRLGADLRREIYLIFKEIINNAGRHSGCGQVDAVLRREGSYIVLKVADDGKGFDPDEIGEGNGLISMRERAQRLGGEISFESNNGHGACVTLKAPYHHNSGWLKAGGRNRRGHGH
jgi:ligand-binding sensor domain-containing protein/two-component sensor histidine kinase